MQFHRISVFILGALVLAGCSVKMNPRIPNNGGVARRVIALAVAPEARGAGDVVGRGTFTAFAIPVSKVKVTNGHTAQLLSKAFRETAQGEGYQIADAPAPGSLLLVPRVLEMDFMNYTWLFPIVYTGGDIKIQVDLE